MRSKVKTVKLEKGLSLLEFHLRHLFLSYCHTFEREYVWHLQIDENIKSKLVLSSWLVYRSRDCFFIFNLKFLNHTSANIH